MNDKLRLPSRQFLLLPRKTEWPKTKLANHNSAFANLTKGGESRGFLKVTSSKHYVFGP